jgi:hypothetical protein
LSNRRRLSWDGLQFTLEQNINKVNLTQLLSNVEKQDENNSFYS